MPFLGSNIFTLWFVTADKEKVLPWLPGPRNPGPRDRAVEDNGAPTAGQTACAHYYPEECPSEVTLPEK